MHPAPAAALLLAALFLLLLSSGCAEECLSSAGEFQASVETRGGGCPEAEVAEFTAFLERQGTTALPGNFCGGAQSFFAETSLRTASCSYRVTGEEFVLDGDTRRVSVDFGTKFQDNPCCSHAMEITYRRAVP